MTILEQGLIYGILALGLLITYRILDFPDLTVDSSFPLGAAVSAILTVNGVNPGLTLLAAIAAGAGAGLITGLIHVKCKVRDLLSGIITMTALYSVNLRIAGKANVPLFAYDTLFKNDFTKALPEWIAPYATLILILLIALVSKLLLDLFLKTKAGYLLRAAGDNAAVVTTLARDQGGVKIIGLMIANALVSLAGAVLCQQQRFFDISMGTGTMVIGLASVIIQAGFLYQVHHGGAHRLHTVQGLRFHCPVPGPGFPGYEIGDGGAFPADSGGGLRPAEEGAHPCLRFSISRRFTIPAPCMKPACSGTFPCKLPTVPLFRWWAAMARAKPAC